MSDLEKIGSLWKRTSKKGTTYLAGEIDGRKVVIFKVREKKNDKSPDYQVLLSKELAKQNAASANTPAPPRAGTTISDEDIPF